MSTALPIGLAWGKVRPGAAAALKMAYAAYTKGRAGLLLFSDALAAHFDVAVAHTAEWRRSPPELALELDHVAGAVAPKAWRFAGEMMERSRTYEAAALPAALHQGTAARYERLAPLKQESVPDLARVLRWLLTS